MKANTNINVRQAQPCCFLHGARCTNVNTFEILPHPATSGFGEEASELGFMLVQNF